MTENEHTWLISGDTELATHVARRAARANITSDELVQRILTVHLDTPENVAIAEQSRRAEVLLVEGRAEEVIQRLLHAPLAVLG